MLRANRFACAALIGGAMLASQASAVTFVVPADAPNGVPFISGLSDGRWGILDVRNNGNMDNQDLARASLASNGGTRVIGTASAINHVADGGGTGHFGGDLAFPQGNGDNKAVMFRGTVYAPVAGVYTLNVASDDGFTLAIDGGTQPFSNLYNQNGGNPGTIETYNGNASGALTFFGGRGTEDTGARVFLSAGAHQFDMTFHDGCCGDAVELSAAFGGHNGFIPGVFSLIDDKLNVAKTIIPGIVGQIEVEAVNGLPAQNIASAKAHIAGNDGPTSLASVINHRDPDNGVCCGGLDNGQLLPFPNDTPGDNNNFATQFRGTLEMPIDGEVIVHIQSDDGFSFQIDGAQWEILSSGNMGATSVQNGGSELVADFGTGNSDVVARLLLGQGQHSFALTHWDGDGGSYMQVFVGGIEGLGGVLIGSVPAGFGADQMRLSLTPSIPEPATAMLGVLGVALMGLRRRRVA